MKKIFAKYQENPVEGITNRWGEEILKKVPESNDVWNKTWWISRWVEPLQSVALKDGVLHMWSKPFAPQGEAGSWGFLLNYCHRARSGIYDKIMSQREFLSEKIVSCIAVYIQYIHGRREIQELPVSILVWNLTWMVTINHIFRNAFQSSPAGLSTVTHNGNCSGLKMCPLLAKFPFLFYHFPVAFFSFSKLYYFHFHSYFRFYF